MTLTFYRWTAGGLCEAFRCVQGLKVIRFGGGGVTRRRRPHLSAHSSPAAEARPSAGRSSCFSHTLHRLLY